MELLTRVICHQAVRVLLQSIAYVVTERLKILF
jgi:hypothetical protein